MEIYCQFLILETRENFQILKLKLDYKGGLGKQGKVKLFMHWFHIHKTKELVLFINF